MINLKEQILQTCFERYEGNFSAGDPANNKLNIDRLAGNPELKNYCVREIGSLAIDNQVDFVTAVPNGANWVAEEVADSYELPFVELYKRPDTRQIDFRTEEDYELACMFDGGLIIEDAARTFHNLLICLGLKPLDRKVSIAVSIFDRGDPTSRKPLPINYRALVAEYIPPLLPVDSTYWEYANDRF